MINATPMGITPSLETRTTPVSNTANVVPAPSAQVVPTQTPSATLPPKPKKRMNWKMIAGGVALLIIVVGAAAGLFLSQQNQDVRQQAAGVDPGSGGQTGVCPGNCRSTCDTGEISYTLGHNCSGSTPRCCIYQAAPIVPSTAPMVCTPSQTKCDEVNKKIIKCLPDGSGWTFTAEVCGQAPQPDTSCTNKCTLGAKKCYSVGRVQECKLVNGCTDWQATTTCVDGKTCSNGACVTSQAAACPVGSSVFSQTECSCINVARTFPIGTALPDGCKITTIDFCTAGSSKCDGAKVYTCESNKWVNSSTCPSGQVCSKDVDGKTSCVQGCTEGNQRCSGLARQTCTNSKWVTTDACGTGFICQMSGSVASCEAPPTSPQCTTATGRPTGCTCTTNSQCTSSICDIESGTTGKCIVGQVTLAGQCQKIGTNCAFGSSPVDNQSCASLRNVQSTVYTGKMCQADSISRSSCDYDSDCPADQVCRASTTGGAKSCVPTGQGGQYGCLTCNGLNCTYTCSQNAEMACFSCPKLINGRCMTNQVYSGTVTPNQSMNLASLVNIGGGSTCWHQCDWNNPGDGASQGSLAAKTFYYCEGGVNPPPAPPEGPGEPPAPPEPTPPPTGPICLNITSDKPTPKIGDQVTFTCGKVTGVTSYDFKLVEPDGNVIIQKGQTANNPSSRSTPFKITKAGKYTAQCRICVSDKCQAFETIAGGN